MRRALSLVVFAVLLAVPPAAAQAAPGEDSVVLTGGPAVAAPFTIFTLEARSGPSGENPTGQVRFDFDGGFLRIDGTVTCLAVTGNTAIINIRDPAFDAILTLRVVDGTPDTFEVISIERSATDCSPGGPSFQGFLQTGDITIVDAPPLPTSKDQCKNGGWRAFGVFKNQGDCVSFVATRGRNQPADP